MSRRPPTLLLSVGNPSRGDDALGWHFAERARERFAELIASEELEVLTDFQLQVEHALDIEGRAHVLFVDASVSAPAPYALTPLREEPATAFSHALSPGHLLRVLDELGHPRPARMEVLAIRGERFELGDPLSARAAHHLDEALLALEHHLGPAQPHGLRLTVTGIVQGVGFRPFVARTARALDLTGSVRNGPDGVVIELWGPAPRIDQFIQTLQGAPPPGAAIRSWSRTPLSGSAPPHFEIAATTPGAARLSIPPDLALCPDCRRDLSTPSDRHFDHPFTSCTACGPRLSITTALPYDRAHTTMAHFPMCHECDTEYATESDRRYHAQAIACPRCGPRLALLTPARTAIGGDPLNTAAALLRDGKILAIQALGGFHLACDASSAEATQRLRERKHRDAKPFAVMVGNLEHAERLALLTTEARALLTSSTGPIVLLRRRPATSLAAEVCGDASRVGVFLPTTPLHARLLSRLDLPLVMTSGNLSGEPVAITHDEAFAALSGIADAFLVHDRPIARRVEDSVVSCEPGLPPRVIRRARGYAPRPIRLPIGSPTPTVPILAVGGHMKNTAALVLGDECWLTPHLGDLDTHTAELAWARDVEGFASLLGVDLRSPTTLVVHDAHPDYATTRYAERYRRRLAVQHHHAHVLAVLAERRTLEPVLALAFDGTGWGPDLTAWGGEILRVDGLDFTRPTALRPIPLPGGERAIHEVWRAAYGALFDTFGPETPELFAKIPHTPMPCPVAIASAADAIQEALTRGFGKVYARGLGRYFDAAASLILGQATARFEGELPMRLEDLAQPRARPYPFEVPSRIDTSSTPNHTLSSSQEIDLRPMWRALVDDIFSQVSPTTMASRVHATLVAATLATIEQHHLAAGVRRVVLTGGAFQNRLLERAFRDAFGAVVLDPLEVPVNDGGLALGQALAGALHLSRNGGP